MKILLDSCVAGGVKKILEEAGYETIWVGDFTTDPGDEAIIHQAYLDNRILVTLDKDFGELAIVKIGHTMAFDKLSEPGFTGFKDYQDLVLSGKMLFFQV
jgi:hypothetical protein